MNNKICILCGKQYKGWGNNPYPIEEKGQCCDECNIKIVIPARIKTLKKSK